VKKGSIGFIGLGNMAGAIITGLRLSEAYRDTVIHGTDHNASKREDYRSRCNVAVLPDAGSVAKESELLVLAIKPQGLDALLAEIGKDIGERKLVVSLAAGKRLSFYEQRLGRRIPLVTAIPNVNAKIGLSSTALCKNDAVTPEQMKKAVALFEAVGGVAVLPEDKLAAYSAISGAGPAFAYLFADALASAGLKAGLARRDALQAACEMLEGSARMILASGEHPRALADQVTSPGGTTIEGMHTLAKLGFEHAVHEAVQAVIRKNQWLAEQAQVEKAE